MPKIIMAKSAGFCFGVSKAVDTVYHEVDNSQSQVYTYGPIIHNEEVVHDLETKGVIVTDELSLDELKEGSTIIIRSHGVSKDIIDRIENKRLKIVDATCPFVKKIHHIVMDENSKGRRVVIIGDPKHPEVCGIKGWGREDTIAISTIEEFYNVNIPKDTKISIVAQTTFNYNNFQEIVDKITNLGYDVLCFNTICNATQERQAEAGSIAAEVDTMIVIGDRFSSNTKKLVEICSERCSHTLFIQTVKDIKPEDLHSVRCVGITAGASTPKHIIEEVQNYVRHEF